MNYQDINAATIDRWIEQGWEWGKPIDHETYLRALHGEWDVLLTPLKPVPHEWFGNLKGKKVLIGTLSREGIVLTTGKSVKYRGKSVNGFAVTKKEVHPETVV